MNNYSIESHPFFAKHSTNSLLGSMWNFYKSHFVALFIFAFGISLLENLFSAFFIDTQLLTEMANLNGDADLTNAMPHIKRLIPLYLCLGAIQLIYNLCFLHYIIYSPIVENYSPNVTIKGVVRLIVPSFIVATLWLFALALAMQLMLLGSFVMSIIAFFMVGYIMIVFNLIFPTLLTEGSNIANALSHSIKIANLQLMRNMWWIYLIYILYLTFVVVISYFTGLLVENMAVLSNPLHIILLSATSAIAFPYTIMLSAMLYFNGIALEKRGVTEK